MTASESSNYLLQPDILLPQQYLARHRRNAVAEQGLMFAILQDAINCYQKHAFATDRHGRRVFGETVEWIECPDREPFSFEYICEVLSLNSDYLRSGLESWRRREFDRRSEIMSRNQPTHH